MPHQRTPGRLAVVLLGLALTLGNGAPVAADNGPAVIGPFTVAQFNDAFPIHGVDGDTAVLFTVQPSPTPTRPPGVHVVHRFTGQLLGDVVPPPGGWDTPLTIVIETYSQIGLGTQGRFLLLDAGGPPVAAGQVVTRLHRYSYAYSPTEGFTSQYLETHRPPTPTLGTAPPNGIYYALGFALLNTGEVAVSDTVPGAIWVAGPSLEDWRLAMMDPDFAPAPADPVQGIGRAPGGGTRVYNFQTPGGIYPGIHSLTYAALTDEVCATRTAPPGGIWCVRRPVLLDSGTPANAKSFAKRAAVPPLIGVSDATDGVAYDRHSPGSRWLYWARAIADVRFGGLNTLRRVDLLTGEMQVVASSNMVWDWTSNVAVLPPLLSSQLFTTVLSAVGQEENNPVANALLNGVPQYVGPSPVPICLIRS